MSTKYTSFLRSVRRARVVLVGNKPKSDIIEVVVQHKGLDDAITQLNNFRGGA